jgi:DNA-binding LacI/PurR family transcriptional regulator
MNNRLRNKNHLKDEVKLNVANYTINDIARELGYSKTTISRAISGKGRIGTETRDKVMAWIADHGYTPNPVAQALAVSRTFNVGITLPEDASGGDVPFFQDCLVSITGALAAYNYDVILIIVSENDISGLKRIIKNRKVDGIVLTRLLVSDQAVSYLEEEQIPFVLIGTGADSTVYQVDSNQKNGCRELTDHLFAAGCRTIALLAGNPEHMVNRLRYEGYAEAVAGRTGSIDTRFVFWNAQRNIENIIMSLVEQHVDCIACMDDTICADTLFVLKQHNVHIPQDIQLVSFYDSTGLRNYNPAVTALHVENRKVSIQAGNLLIDLIEGRPCKHDTFIDYTVVYRDSSR